MIYFDPRTQNYKCVIEVNNATAVRAITRRSAPYTCKGCGGPTHDLFIIVAESRPGPTTPQPLHPICAALELIRMEIGGTSL